MNFGAYINLILTVIVPAIADKGEKGGMLERTGPIGVTPETFVWAYVPEHDILSVHVWSGGAEAAEERSKRGGKPEGEAIVQDFLKVVFLAGAMLARDAGLHTERMPEGWPPEEDKGFVGFRPRG